jgi:alpha-glucosidase
VTGTDDLPGAAPWWRLSVLYQIYPRSFADSDGDGIGDLAGIIGRLDHLEWLGIDGVWLSPITVSPNADWGYDVADYRTIDAAYGTWDELDTLIAEAGRRGIRVIMDLVANHTSDHHPWFVDARSSRGSRHRDWYVWAAVGVDGTPPNNWTNALGAPAWTVDPTTGQAYLHNFTPAQPDLNWWNPDVRSEFDDIQRFWFNRGVAGVRIDMANMLIKDAELRDNPPCAPDDDFVTRLLGQRPIYNRNRPEVHEVLRGWRKIAESYDPPRLLLGETVVQDLGDLARFYGDSDDELQLALNVPFQEAAFTASALRTVVEATESVLGDNAWPLWSGSNHDISRLASRWAAQDPARVRVALMMLLTLRGTPLLYQGDELGLPDTPLDRTDLRDPLGELLWPAHPGRDPARTPMPWSDTPGGGFTAAGVEPWLCLGDVAVCNVEAQLQDPGSTLRFTHDLIVLRRATPDLLTGDRVAIPASDPVWAWRRGATAFVALNLGAEQRVVDGIVGRIAITTSRRRDGVSVTGRLDLDPWEGVVVMTNSAHG